MDEVIHPDEARAWLGQLRAGCDTRDRLIVKMRSMGSKRVFPILTSFLSDPDPEVRCLICETLFRIDSHAAFDAILPLLDDPEWFVRVEACGLLHDIADNRAVPALIERMKTDSDPMVRNTAAYALGGIGDPAAIPALIDTLEHDHERDEVGHCASGCAATALDNILKTNHTRIKLADGLCTMQPAKLDVELLKKQAMEYYRSQHDPTG